MNPFVDALLLQAGYNAALVAIGAGLLGFAGGAVGTWHGVLTPLSKPGLFAVIDRIGDGANLEEHWFEAPYRVA